MKKVLIVDDHPLMRKGLALTLDDEPNLTVCALASTAEEALDLMEERDPDLALVDISLPTMSGLELIKHLIARKPDLLVLMVSRHDEVLYAERSIRAGARGYVMKMEGADVILQAVRRVLSGGIYVSDQINERLLQALAQGSKGLMESPMDVLSDRELEVLEFTGRGLGTHDIADRLRLSVKTVESYRARIKMKLNLSSAAELMQHAVQWVEREGSDSQGLA